MDATWPLDDTTKARVLGCLRPYAELLHQLEGKQRALLQARQEARQAIARGASGEALRYLQAQARAMDLALQLTAPLPTSGGELQPAVAVQSPAMAQLQAELNWCNLQMDAQFMAVVQAWLVQDLPPQEVAPEGAPEPWLALREGLSQPSALEAWTRCSVAMGPCLEAVRALEAEVAELLALPPGAQRAAWLALPLAPTAGLAYRVVSPLRQVPGLHEGWKAWRQAWLRGLVAQGQRAKTKPGLTPLAPKKGSPTRRLTDRLSGGGEELRAPRR